jgi:hypothetical protein
MLGRALRAAPTKGRRQSARFPARVSAPIRQALQFPSNNDLPDLGADRTGPFVVLQFNDPQDNGLPIWGTSNGGVSVVWKVKPLATTGYVAWFWWSRGDGGFSAGDGYWGMHPYPQNSANTGTSHWWEVSTDGGDWIDASGNNAGAGTPTAVTVGTVYTQGMTVTRANANSKTFKYYHNLPNVDSANYIQKTVTTASFGETNPTTPKITLGDSPWYATFQHERGAHVLDAIKIFTPALSEADLLEEAADFTRVVTAAGQAAIWWGKNGFRSVDDLTCEFGTGRTFAWADASNKGTLVARL